MTEELSIQQMLVRNRYAQAALSVKGMLQQRLTECAWHLAEMDRKREVEKGRAMTDDHLKQEAVKWARAWTG